MHTCVLCSYQGCNHELWLDQLLLTEGFESTPYGDKKHKCLLHIVCDSISTSEQVLAHASK